MMVSTLIDAVRARGEIAAAAAVARVSDAVVSTAAAELPGVSAERTPQGVVLRGRGLRARAFGTIRRAADPRFAALTLLVRR